MSRWKQQFDSHPFQANWVSLREVLREAEIQDLSIPAAVAELARLKKVIFFLDAILGDIDPELIPLAILDASDQQARQCLADVQAFSANQSSTNLQSANACADNLLSLIRPYMLTTGKVAAKLAGAAQEYSSTFSALLERFSSSVGDTLAEIASSKEAIGAKEREAEKIVSVLLSQKARLVGDGASEFGEIGAVDNKIHDFEEKYREIMRLHEEVFEGSRHADPIKDSIFEAASEAKERNSAILSLKEKSEEVVKQLRDFHGIVYGVPGEDGSMGGGLDDEIKKKLRKIEELEVDQAKRYAAINERIEDLLPGATSAGLASAYEDVKKSFDEPIRAAEKHFRWTITALVILAVLMTIQKVYLWGIDFRQIATWQDFIGGLAVKLPVFGPLIWFAYYASKRRSEFQRLQQEYGHKEALARSYESFKKQAEALGDQGHILLKNLLSSAISAIAYNASQTLDGKHGDSMPTEKIIEKILEKHPGK